tara:strand:- start:46312 stop:46494 length:183 start_codon:yes stop_codon:yes gene_type:complete
MSAIAAGLSSGQLSSTQKLPLHGMYGSSPRQGEKVGSGKKRKEIKSNLKEAILKLQKSKD